MNRKHIVTWDMLQIYTKKLAHRVMGIKKWENIIAVTRGGLVPAALLARELSIRYVDTICISSYNYNFLKKIKLIKKSNLTEENLLIIDDLVDTGGTARLIRKIYPKAYFVTIFAKPKGRKLVDNYIIDIPQNVWIEQPWDMAVSYIAPLIKESKIL
ncbi:xanthine phosphoribosyltransferase [Buchnera aphidicola]|uniref:Xanthine phosphoribosyltransferase n=1 Tax=Buchnera aphidicola (Sarucallis kahawaluokalani) TaxID=1241878 RepID=A0A4D6YJT2_9GAMM|nr:xanthine phosphoribosyltransferase [Buchnera aphidicola]QCI25968.1 xanthine phosphoribosyltransferase [Buchnera aphidicola (Sarucallis kahawaluokalani)]